MAKIIEKCECGNEIENDMLNTGVCSDCERACEDRFLDTVQPRGLVLEF